MGPSTWSKGGFDEAFIASKVGADSLLCAALTVLTGVRSATVEQASRVQDLHETSAALELIAGFLLFTALLV